MQLGTTGVLALTCIMALPSWGCSTGSVESDSLRSGFGVAVRRQTVVEAPPPADSDDVFVDNQDAPDPVVFETQDAPATVCDDVGPVFRPLIVGWADVPLAESVAELDDGVAWLTLENATEHELQPSLTIIIGNGSESFAHSAASEPTTIQAGETAWLPVDLGTMRIGNPKVHNSENALARVDFDDPSSGSPSQAFSPVLYFHHDGVVLLAYGAGALVDEFGGGGFKDFGLFDGLDEHELGLPESVLMGTFISEG